ncbi:translocating chain-associated membrane protein 2 isoform X2 [Prinia subflava]|uniref:translocating chain-associated membrane protein 2 isoform X2 n=1 Tax=Prinia subflava TaxID=208062 RepID=UPI002FE0E63D
MSVSIPGARSRSLTSELSTACLVQVLALGPVLGLCRVRVQGWGEVRCQDRGWVPVCVRAQVRSGSGWGPDRVLGPGLGPGPAPWPDPGASRCQCRTRSRCGSERCECQCRGGVGAGPGAGRSGVRAGAGPGAGRSGAGAVPMAGSGWGRYRCGSGRCRSRPGAGRAVPDPVPVRVGRCRSRLGAGRAVPVPSRCGSGGAGPVPVRVAAEPGRCRIRSLCGSQRSRGGAGGGAGAGRGGVGAGAERSRAGAGRAEAAAPARGHRGAPRSSAGPGEVWARLGPGHGLPPAGQEPPALQPGVPHPQPRRHRLLPGAQRPHRPHVRGDSQDCLPVHLTSV